MQEVVIKLDYSHGPIWQNKYDAATGVWSTGINDGSYCVKDEETEHLLKKAS